MAVHNHGPDDPAHPFCGESMVGGKLTGECLKSELARAYYNAWVWSGCDGSRWDRLSEEARSDWVRQAHRWLFVIRATGKEHP